MKTIMVNNNLGSSLIESLVLSTMMVFIFLGAFAFVFGCYTLIAANHIGYETLLCMQEKKSATICKDEFRTQVRKWNRSIQVISVDMQNQRNWSGGTICKLNSKLAILPFANIQTIPQTLTRFEITQELNWPDWKNYVTSH